MAEAPGEDKPKYPQITEAELDLWLSQRATKHFLQALEWRAQDAQDALGTGVLLDSSNADLSHAMSHGALGKQDAYRDAAKPEQLLDFYELIFRPPTEEETDAGDQQPE